jgi:hypothetical protein
MAEQSTSTGRSKNKALKEDDIDRLFTLVDRASRNALRGDNW